MAKKQEAECETSGGLKMAVALILILQLVMVGHLVSNHIEENKLHYEYETSHIKLNNTNDFSYVDGKIVDYLCDENVEFKSYGDSYYASTIEIHSYRDWEYRGYGECMIKTRRFASQEKAE